MTTNVSGTGTTGTATSATTSSAKSGWASLGAQDFMKLLTAQLNNQDPTSPMDNSQMVAQLAQFSSLSGITSMGDTLKTISGQITSLTGSAS